MMWCEIVIMFRELCSQIGWIFSNCFWIIFSIQQTQKINQKLENQLNLIQFNYKREASQNEMNLQLEYISNEYLELRLQIISLLQCLLEIFLPIYELFLEKKISLNFHAF